MTYDSVVQELDGLIDSLDEHVTIEDVGLALGELRANVFERAKAEKAQTPTDDERGAIIAALLDELGWEWNEVPEEHVPSSRAILGDMADRVLAVSAGFRRSEEPSTPARVTIAHEGGNTVTGTLDEVLNHGHLKPGWRYVGTAQGEPSDAQALEAFLGKLAGDGAYTLDFSSAASLHDHIVRLLKRDIAAMRATGGVR